MATLSSDTLVKQATNEAVKKIVMAPLDALNIFRMGAAPGIPGESKNVRMLKDSGKTVAAWMALGYLLHQIRHRSTARTVDTGLASYVNRAFPVISPDTDLGDADREAADRMSGVETEKLVTDKRPVNEKLAELKALEESGLLKAASADLQKEADDDDSWWDTLSGPWENKDHSVLHMAALLASAYGGLHLGYKWSQKRSGKGAAKTLDRKIEDARNELDAKLFARLKDRQELQKAASFTAVLVKHAKEDGWNFKGFLLGTDPLRNNPGGLMRGVASVYTTVAAGTALLAYLSAKQYYDNKDPNRKAVKEAERLLKRYMQTPVIPQIQLKLPKELQMPSVAPRREAAGFAI